MIGILIVSHGRFASGLMDSVGMIIGQFEGIGTLELNPGDSPEAFLRRIEAAVDELDGGEGVLIFVDLLGATPFNLSAQVALPRRNTDVITGVNLPMLLEVIMAREGASFDALLGIAEQAGAGSVRVLSKSLADLE